MANGSRQAALPPLPNTRLPRRPSIEHLCKHGPTSVASSTLTPLARTAFAFSSRIPDTGLDDRAQQTVGAVVRVPYRRRGSSELPREVGRAASAAANAFILDNHGIVVVGRDLDETFARLVSLELCAEVTAIAGALGGVSPMLPEADRAASMPRDGNGALAVPEGPGHSEERQALIRVLRRAHGRGLCRAATGQVLVRAGRSTFLTTPEWRDRGRVVPADAVAGRSTAVHGSLCARHAQIGAVASFLTPALPSIGVTGGRLETSVLAESFVLLQDSPSAPWSAAEYPDQPAKRIDDGSGFLLVWDGSLDDQYIRMEVAEFTARAPIRAAAVGPTRPLASDTIAELRSFYVAR